MREPKKRKLVIRFGMAGTAIAGVAVYLNEGLVRAGGIAAVNEEQATVMPPLKDGERFVPAGIIVDVCSAPTGADTATYQLRRAVTGGALGNNGTTLVITGVAVGGRGGAKNAVSYGPSDRMALGVTGSGGAAAHTSDARVYGYVIGRGR